MCFLYWKNHYVSGMQTSVVKRSRGDCKNACRNTLLLSGHPFDNILDISRQNILPLRLLNNTGTGVTVFTQLHSAEIDEKHNHYRDQKIVFLQHTLNCLHLYIFVYIGVLLFYTK